MRGSLSGLALLGVGFLVGCEKEPPKETSRVVAELGTFEKGFDGWTVVGTAFGATPATEPTRGTTNVGAVGSYLSSYDSEQQNSLRGLAISPDFVVPANAFLTLLLGGGNEGVGVRLMEGETAVQTWTGERTGSVKPFRFELGPLAGKTLRLEAFDNNAGDWGHVLLDEVILHEKTTPPGGG